MKPNYDGWQNQETWYVHLWLTNDGSKYFYWREQAAVQRTAAQRDQHVIDGDWPAERTAAIWLGDQLCREVSQHVLLGTSTLYADLLQAALSAVDWQEVAAAFLEELPAPVAEEIVTPKFSLGRVVATPGVLDVVTLSEMSHSLTRHAGGDWGLMGREDWIQNERALQDGGRLMSLYQAIRGPRYWIITEADRSVTTLLLPSEY